MAAWQVGPIVRGMRGHRAAALLVVVQLGFGVALTVLAVLIGDSFRAANRFPADFAEDDLALVEVQLPGRSAGSDAARRQADVLADLRATPGVTGATVVQALPLGVLDRAPDAVAAGPGGPAVRAYALDGGAGLAAVAGLHVRAGRDLTDADLAAGAATPALISERLARALWPDRDPVGARFVSRAHGPAVVVGVVDDMRTHLFGPDQTRVIYAHHDRRAARVAVLVRSAPGQAARVRAALRERLDQPGLHAVVTPVGEQARQRAAPVTAVVGILAVMVASIVLVVLIGSMGLTYFLVSERTREIGLRRAMGATRRDVVRDFVLENAVLTGAGVLVGLAIVAAIVPALVRNQDDFVVRWPLVVLTGAAVVGLDLIAALIPARRAAAVPPVVASRTT